MGINMRFFVTGGTGYIGSACVKSLLEQGHSVLASTRDLALAKQITNYWQKQNIPLEKLTWCQLDLINCCQQELQRHLLDIDYVLHLASPVPTTLKPKFADLVVPAVTGVRKLMQALSGSKVKRVVMTSSIASMRNGHDKQYIFDANSWSDLSQPIGAYSFSKTYAEMTAWNLANMLADMPELVTIQPGFVIGEPAYPEQRSASINFLKRLLQARIIMPAYFNLVTLEDVVAVHIQAALKKTYPGQRLPCCHYDATSLLEINAWLNKQGLGQAKYNFPKKLCRFLPQRYQLYFADNVKIDAAATKAALSWQPRPVAPAIIAMAKYIIKHKL